MRAIKVYCPPGAEPPLYAFIDALDGKLKARGSDSDSPSLISLHCISPIWADCKDHSDTGGRCSVA